jgi:hypothetical protein
MAMHLWSATSLYTTVLTGHCADCSFHSIKVNLGVMLHLAMHVDEGAVENEQQLTEHA